MSLDKLYSSNDDFMESIDRGLEIIKTSRSDVDSDHQNLKDLLAVLITGTIPLNKEAINDPELDQKLLTVRAVLLAAYELGRKSNGS